MTRSKGPQRRQLKTIIRVIAFIMSLIPALCATCMILASSASNAYTTQAETKAALPPENMNNNIIPVALAASAAAAVPIVTSTVVKEMPVGVEIFDDFAKPEALPNVEPIEEQPSEPAPTFLLEIDKPDPNYQGCVVELTDYDRQILGRLVMGEAGTEGMVGAALLAQAIHDAMVYDGFKTVEAVRRGYRYSGSLRLAPNQDVLDAIDYIFDQGQAAVQHKILFMYTGKSYWHETQEFIVQYRKVRYFDSWDPGDR